MRRSRETDRDSPGPGQRSERCFLEASGADHTGPLPPKEDSWAGRGGVGGVALTHHLCCSLNQHLRLLHLP